MEIFKNINGFKGNYKISNLGRVSSLYRMGSKGGFLKVYKSPQGYLRIGLMYKGKQRYYFLHKLIANAFISNPNNKPYINHINGIKDDNRLENLEWCTASENVIHAYKTGLKIVTKNNHFIKNNPRSHKGKFGKDNHLSKKVYQYDLDGNLIKTWGSTMDIQRELGIKNSNISRCCKGGRPTAKGYVWKYN